MEQSRRPSLKGKKDTYIWPLSCKVKRSASYLFCPLVCSSIMGPSFKLIGESTPQNWFLEDDACCMMPIISGVNVIDLLLWSNHCVHLSFSGKNQNGPKKTTGHTQPITNTKPYQTIQHPPFFSDLVNPPFFSHSVNYSYIWVAIHKDVASPFLVGPVAD